MYILKKIYEIYNIISHTEKKIVAKDINFLNTKK